MTNDDLHVVHPRAAGLGVHKLEITATVRLCATPRGEPTCETRTFSALASGLDALVAWARRRGRGPGADELQFTIGEGRVTLIASDALLGDVLAEWERAGNTRFVDAGDLDEVPVSLHLVDVPEAEALRLLLRPAAGYLAARRAPLTPGASVYDRVKILAGRANSPPPRSAPATRPAQAVATAATRVPGASGGGGRPEDDLGNGAPPAELSEAAQIERLPTRRRRLGSARNSRSRRRVPA